MIISPGTLQIHHMGHGFLSHNTDGDLRVTLRPVGRGTESCSSCFFFNQCAGLIHIADLRVGGFPDHRLVGGVGRFDDQTQVILFRAQGREIDVFRKADVLDRLNDLHLHLGEDLRRRLRCHCHGGGTGGHGGEHPAGVHRHHILVIGREGDAGPGGVCRLQPAGQLLPGPHIHPERGLGRDDSRDVHQIHHMDGDVPPDRPVGRGDADNSVTLGQGLDPPLGADLGDVRVQRFIAQLQHAGRLAGLDRGLQPIGHPGVQCQLVLFYQNIGDLGAGKNNIIIIPDSIAQRTAQRFGESAQNRFGHPINTNPGGPGVRIIADLLHGKIGAFVAGRVAAIDGISTLVPVVVAVENAVFIAAQKADSTIYEDTAFVVAVAAVGIISVP